MERFYTFFGSSLKKDLDLLRFLYLQKVLSQLKKSVPPLLLIDAQSKKVS